MIIKKNDNYSYFKDNTVLSLKYNCLILSIFLVNPNNKLSNIRKYDNINNKLRINFGFSNFVFSLLLVYTNLLLGYYRSYGTSLRPCSSAIKGVSNG